MAKRKCPIDINYFYINKFNEEEKVKIITILKDVRTVIIKGDVEQEITWAEFLHKYKIGELLPKELLLEKKWRKKK